MFDQLYKLCAVLPILGDGNKWKPMGIYGAVVFLKTCGMTYLILLCQHSTHSVSRDFLGRLVPVP